jgi:hypothetical protein
VFMYSYSLVADTEFGGQALKRDNISLYGC